MHGLFWLDKARMRSDSIKDTQNGFNKNCGQQVASLWYQILSGHHFCIQLRCAWAIFCQVLSDDQLLFASLLLNQLQENFQPNVFRLTNYNSFCEDKFRKTTTQSTAFGHSQTTNKLVNEACATILRALVKEPSSLKANHITGFADFTHLYTEQK